MIYSIASGELSIAEIWHFPISLAKTLDAFRMEEHSGEMLLDISVIRKMPEIKAAQLATPTLKIGNGKKGETLLSFSRSPQCMVETKTDKKSVVFYISETSDLADPGLAEQARVLLRMVFEDAAAKKRILSLHASAVVMNGMGICVTGPSGAGKSTLSRNLLQAVPGSFVLNADRPAIKAEEEGFSVWGAPWSGKEQIFINGNAPLQAIVEVRKHCSNKIQRLDTRRAYRLLLKRVSKPQWDPEATSAVMDTLLRLISEVSVYRFYCANDVSAGEDLRDALAAPEKIPWVPKEEKDMKVKNEYVLRKVLDDYMAMPVGASADQGAIMLNETGAFLWEKLRETTTEEALREELLAEFDVDPETAEKDIRDFLEFLRRSGALEEE